MKIAAGCLIAGVFALLLCALGPKPQFTVDGYDYAIMMLMDRGIPYHRAQSQAARFFATKPIAKMPEYERWLHGKPEYWELFSVRRVDPWLAAVLYRWRGFQALTDVSQASYVAVAVLIVVLAARFAPIPYAVVMSFLVSLFPPWRDIARDSLTDALAVALVTATLLAGLRVLRRRSVLRLTVFTVLCGALAFTRPVAYIVAGGALVAVAVALLRKDRDAVASGAWIAGIASLWTLATVAAMHLARAPSFSWIVADTYEHLVARGYAAAGANLTRWYFAQELAILRDGVRDAVAGVVPLLALAGIALRRADPATPLLAGACAATWLGAIADPSTQDMIRCVVMPVAPVIGAFAAAAMWAAVTFVPVLIGPQAQSLRLNLPGRSSVRKDTVKE
jgi:hypothetical protein